MESMKTMLYNNLSDSEKKDLIYKEYIHNNKSFSSIAKQYKTYANKVRRDAKKFEIPIRSKSEAQKNALAMNIVQHPTKGKNRTEAEKNKIGLSVHESWMSLSVLDKNARSQKAKELWSKMSVDDKANMQTAAHAAIRSSSKTGSKLEKFLLEQLLRNGYRVEFHKEQVLSNTKLQIDIYLPDITTAIEVDGPSHFEPVWGNEALIRNQKYDNNKNGLIIGRGMKLVRIKQNYDFSPTRGRLVFQKLKDILDNIQNSKIKIFHIED